MRVETATRFPATGPLSAFRALADRLWERSALAGKLDDATRATAIARAAKSGSLLDSGIYGKPQGEWMEPHVAALEAAVSDEAPGFTVKAISMWGKARTRRGSGESDCRLGFFGQDAAGNPRLFSFRHEKPKNMGSGSPETEDFARWMIQEKIVMIRASEGQWAWKTTKPADHHFNVVHPLKEVGSQMDLDRAQSLLVERSARIAGSWREKRDELAQRLAQEAAERAARNAVPEQIKRLSELLPESLVEQAAQIEAARDESQHLAREAGLPKAGASSPSSAPRGPKPRRV